MYHDSANTNPFLIFHNAVFPSQKFTIPKHVKRKIVFSLINADWIVRGILYFLF